MFVTFLNENRTQANLLEHRKDLLANIANYDGKDKKACLMWINQLEQIAIQARMPLKELLAAKAGPIVMSAVTSFLAREPDASDAQVKQMILESFSNVGTRNRSQPLLKENETGERRFTDSTQCRICSCPRSRLWHHTRKAN